ncbi:hypothetical protein J5N97_002241 [Dioscorea zingiberensis]|uniref:Glutaredoxin domain-containing protein n=1 Tax=Dioscorea zingiberensis TaxID=325984 RepID=A0A9D5D1V2_9LILI|nr:hypothetical protein J5N97_002241 [Dioscorea zingiberensis]
MCPPSVRTCLTCRPSSFSFKDVQALLRDDDHPVLHRACASSPALRSWHSLPKPSPIVLYFTSLRIIRKTFDDCSTVRSLLRALRVAVDERDLSMDSSYLSELTSLLGCRPPPSLPLLFIAGRFVGGADEIVELHEKGQLRRLLDGAPPTSIDACGRCGGAKFVLCGECSGSHKQYSENGGFRRCAACNENGLVRCFDCCFPTV